MSENEEPEVEEDEDDGYGEFRAALADPAAAVALLLEPDSNTVSVMIEVMVEEGGNAGS